MINLRFRNEIDVRIEICVEIILSLLLSWHYGSIQSPRKYVNWIIC
jgi:hypothetical protein